MIQCRLFSWCVNPSGPSSVEFLWLCLVFGCESLHPLPSLLNDFCLITIDLWVEQNMIRNYFMFGFLTGLWARFWFLANHSWSTRQCQAWDPSCGMDPDLKLDQSWVDHSQKFCPIIAPCRQALWMDRCPRSTTRSLVSITRRVRITLVDSREFSLH